MGGRLRISVLGELEVTRDGQALPLPPSRKTRALLAYLAVVARPQRREHLCDLFWEIPDDPRASLRWSLHKIRQIANAADRECLTADHDRVLLDPKKVDLDLARVARLAPCDPDGLDTASLESAAAAFRGDFLEGLHLPRCPKFEAWRLYHAEAASRLRLRILRALVSRFRDQPDRALGYAHTLRSLGPEEAGAATAPIPDIRAHGAPGLPGNPPETRARVSNAASSRTPQEIRFCSTPDDVRIAYAVCGQGPPIVRAAHWMSHLQYDWESPVWWHWIDAFSEETTLIRYDERGNGLSDRDAADLSFEAMVADLESVVDAAGLDRFTLLGVSQSCAVSVAYAVRHPERVSGLVLYGGFVKGWRKRGDRHEVATHEAMTTLIREGWGKDNPVFRQLFTVMFIPGASSEQIAWFNELQRITVSPANAGRLHESFGQIDVSAMLPRVAVPTLVLHARHDAAVPFQSGRAFATGIPGARFVDLDSANHVLLRDEPAFLRLVREVKTFVSETARR